MAEIRKQQELDNPQVYNYYLAFKIDPNEKNAQKIEEAIKKQKSSWAQGNPNQRRYIALFQDIISVMVNDMGYDSKSDSYSVPGARAKELAAAKKFKLDTTANAIVLASAGIVYKSRLQEVRKKERFNWYSLDELEAAISAQTKGQGIKFIDDTQNLIDFVTYKNINDQLKTVDKANIYEFLNGSTPKSSPADLCAEADAVYRGIKSRTTAEGTASGNLVGLAKKVFADDAAKKKYEDYLAVRDQVWDQMESISAGNADKVNVEKYEEWMNAIRSGLGIDQDTAEKYIAAGLKNYHLSIVGGQDKLKLVECPHPDCKKLYRYDEKSPARICPHCGKSLVDKCWNCNGDMDIKRSDCPQCGATKAQKVLFEKSVTAMEAAEASTTATVTDLENALDNLKACVPDYKKKPCKVKEKVDYYEPIVKARRDREIKYGNAYKEAISKINSEKLLKNFMKAHSMAEDLKTTFPSYKLKESLALISGIEVEINKA